jgi:hypothetical protein
MSRSGYTDDNDDPLATGRWRAQVNSAIRGKRGQSFLRELAAAMDAMPEKVLITDELIDEHGDCCTIGVVCKNRSIDIGGIDYNEPEEIANAVGIAKQLVAEIEYENDECGVRFERIPGTWDWDKKVETPEERWQRMRRWVQSKIIEELT